MSMRRALSVAAGLALWLAALLLLTIACAGDRDPLEPEPEPQLELAFVNGSGRWFVTVGPPLTVQIVALTPDGRVSDRLDKRVTVSGGGQAVSADPVNGVATLVVTVSCHHTSWLYARADGFKEAIQSLRRTDLYGPFAGLEVSISHDRVAAGAVVSAAASPLDVCGVNTPYDAEVRVELMPNPHGVTLSGTLQQPVEPTFGSRFLASFDDLRLHGTGTDLVLRFTTVEDKPASATSAPFSAVPLPDAAIAFYTDDGLFVVDPDDDAGAIWIAHGSYPSWSPDGRRLIYPFGVPARFRILDLDSFDVIEIGGCPPVCYAPRWSPDGQRIAFSSYGAILVMDADGTGLVQVTPSDMLANVASWSPNGERLAFGSNDGVYVINIDGTGLARLSSGNDYGPAWSPDGTKIVFHRRDVGLFVMAADGTGVEQLTGSPDDISPAWSPDGARIAFAGIRDGATQHLYVMNANGTGIRRLTNLPIHAFAPAWRP
jgi:WD40 repeat protein